jgi:hypothetical protein
VTLTYSSDLYPQPFSTFLRGPKTWKSHDNRSGLYQEWSNTLQYMEHSMLWTVPATWGWALLCNMVTLLVIMAVQRSWRVPQLCCALMVISGWTILRTKELNDSLLVLYGWILHLHLTVPHCSHLFWHAHSVARLVDDCWCVVCTATWSPVTVCIH